MLVPALRTVGNIVTGDDMQTQVIIGCGALTCLLHLLKTAQKKSIKKEACWTISNITAGTKDQIQAVIDAGAAPRPTALLAVSVRSAWRSHLCIWCARRVTYAPRFSIQAMPAHSSLRMSARNVSYPCNGHRSRCVRS